MWGILLLLISGNLGWQRYIIEDDFAQTWSGATMDTAHINNDTLMDVLVTGSTTGGEAHPIFWYRMEKADSFTQFQIGSENDPDGIGGVDLNNDGLTDIMVACLNKVIYFPNMGGSFGSSIVMHPSAGNVGTLRSRHSCWDVSGDGDVDVVTSALDLGVQWIENEGSSIFTPHLIPPRTWSSYFMDVDVDGWVDIVSLYDTTWWYRDTTGNGNFSSRQFIDSTYLIGFDLDGDGDKDWLRASPNFSFSLNNGGGNFSPYTTICNQWIAVYRIDAGDLDCDGDIDIVYIASDTIFIAFDTVSTPLPHTPSYKIAVLDTFSCQWISIANMDCDTSNSKPVNDVIAINPKTAVWFKGKCGNTSVEERELRVKSLELRVYPNPSFGNTIIKYGVPEKSNMTLRLYDISGRLVKTLYSGTQEKGYYEVDIKQDELKGGIYFIKLETNEFKATRKLTILK